MAIDYISVPSSTDWEWSGDFTIEAFLTSNGTNIWDLGVTYINIICARTTSGTSYMYFEVSSSMRFRDYASGNVVDAISEPFNLLAGATHHVAVSRTSGVVRLFKDGVALPISGEGGNTYITQSATLTTRSVPLEIGIMSANPAYYTQGWTDSLRISDISRYSSDFTPPTVDFSDDANTLLLLKFDGTDGATTTTDSSSYARTVTFNNSAELDTYIKKFGTSSLKLNVATPVNTVTGRFFNLF